MNTPNPSAALFRLVSGFQVTQAIHVAAVLGIADMLSAGPRDVGELAAASHSHPNSLYRLLRTLSSLGVFREDEGRRFALTAMSEYLRSDKPGSLRGMATLFGGESYWRAWGALLHSVKTGKIAFDHALGEGVWAYRSARPEEGALFDSAMVTFTERVATAALAACDFGRFQHLVDVGGGQGAFIAQILAAHPTVRGTLFDQPHVVANASTIIEQRKIGNRCEIVSGDFFKSVPAGGDGYILKLVLHDWDDESSLAILRSCRRAMRDDSTLIVVEHVIGPLNASPEGKMMDLNMLVITGGVERTQAEFSALFEKAGFRLMRTIPTMSPVSIVEGVCI